VEVIGADVGAVVTGEPLAGKDGEVGKNDTGDFDVGAAVIA
jgi:hypothetical protein